MKKALIIVDPQLDFMPGGSLAIPNGDEIVSHINDTISDYEWDVIIVTREWHPNDHKCFTIINHKNVLDVVDVNGKPMIVWPPHCVQNTEGAKFHPDLKLDNAILFTKGDDINEHPFSGSAGKHGGILLIHYLKNLGIEVVHLVGLAGDYCVKFTAIDCIKYFDVYFDLKGIRFLNDPTETIDELKSIGVRVIN